jgi:hypothetical protein
MDVQQTIQELQEALQRSDDRYNQAMLQLEHTTRATNALCMEVAIACEAYLANDTVLALHKLGQLAANYKRFAKPAGGSVH